MFRMRSFYTERNKIKLWPIKMAKQIANKNKAKDQRLMKAHKMNLQKYVRPKNTKKDSSF